METAEKIKHPSQVPAIPIQLSVRAVKSLWNWKNYFVKYHEFILKYLKLAFLSLRKAFFKALGSHCSKGNFENSELVE